MNPKKKKRLIEASLLFCLLAGIVTGLYFGLFAPKDYRDLIPAESKAVVELPYSMLSEMKLFSDGEKSEFTLPHNGLDDAEPAFLIITPNEYVGLVVKTKNLAQLGKEITESAKKQLCQTPTRAEGFTWTWAKTGWFVAWNEEALLVLGPGSMGERDAMKQTARQMFRSGKSKSFRNSEHQDLVKDIEGEGKVYVRVDAMPMPIGTMLRLSLPEAIETSGVVLTGSLRLDSKGKNRPLLFEGILTSEDSETKKLLDERLPGKVLSSDALQDISASDISFGLNIKGTEFIKKLKGEADGRMLLSAIGDVVNIKNILAQADGEILLSASNLTKKLPEFFMSLQKGNASKERMKCEEIFTDADSGIQPANNGFLKNAQQGTILFEENDSIIYIRTREDGKTLSKHASLNDKGRDVRQLLYINLENTSQDDKEDNPLSIISRFMPDKKKLTLQEFSDGMFNITME